MHVVAATADAAFYYVSLLAMIGCTADSQRFAQLVGGELAIAGGDGQTVDWGNQVAAMRHLLTHVRQGQPPLRRARMLTGKIRVKGFRGLGTFGKLFPSPTANPERAWPVMLDPAAVRG